MEKWKDIKGYEGIYQISNFGRIRSIVFKNGNTQYKRTKLLKIQQTGSYDHICLSALGKQKNFLIHRLVAEAFIPNPNNYKEINHKDENTRNNNVENLEWCDRSYNVNYGNRKQKVKDKMSVKINQYDLNYNFIKTWDCMNDAIRHYNNKHIFDVCKGIRKKASDYIWEYCKE